jgi:DNA-binding NtrC family response regulator
MFPEKVILVVKGESEDADTLARMLSEHFRVVGAEQPEEALSHGSDGVDLVIAELDGPSFSGLQLLRMWIQRSWRTPFLFVTDGSDIAKVVESIKLGAADCVVKPIDHGKLRTVVARLLNGTARDAGVDSMAYLANAQQKPGIDIPPGTSLEDLERAAVEQALTQHQGNRTHAAKTLGISVRTLQRKLKAWGIPLSGSGGAHDSSNTPRENPFLVGHAGATRDAPASFSAHAH